ncbi:MAG: hypothetical protein E7515_03805 [Ruminococcaceae bacterium]|jgi:NADH:ubiquinone oxidoreductase subunit 6 (subunit J)|nr:hypothetical protein [Oscillospiraceae bacterium]
MEGSIKWLMLAVACSVFAIIIMLIGLYRNNSILKKSTDIPEEAEGNKKLAQKVFIKHAVVAGILLVIAVIIKIVTGGADA